LIADRSGRVVGVRVKYAEEVRYLRALKGLILTAGGFNMNNEMVEQYVPHLAQVVRHGTPNDDGSGILLGLSAGGVLNHMDGALITSPIYPPASLLQGIVVNNQGNRFVAEDVYHGRLSAFTLEQPESKAYLILDSETFAYPEYKLQPLIDGWDTVEEMEMALQLPRGSLQCTLDDYNRHAQAGEDPIFHKHSDWIRPLNNAPYAAFDLSLGTATYLSGLTLGGLRVSTDGAVLAKTGMPIAGLYAAGACASNVAQDGAGYASGTCLGQASFFGRCAGRHAARQRG
jgi:succinate dehydrogenase/fumarate reductase flavoprotein subunit